MNTIVEFLIARLDEDEQTAAAAAGDDPAPWTAFTGDGHTVDHPCAAGAGVVFAANDIGLWDCEGADSLCMTAATARHVACHDPARVLREVAAKRQILDLHQPLVPTFGPLEDMQACAAESGEDHWYASRWPCRTLEALATIYAEHPDYDPAWRVEA